MTSTLAGLRDQMMCGVLLLLSATCCVCGAFKVSVTQSSYQAEENQNITLEWRFTTKPGSSLKDLFVSCGLVTERKASALYHLEEGVEVPESQDKQFAGRVQCDKDTLKDGRIRLLVSRLRTDDSGPYLCKVNTDYGMDTGTCQLNVTVAADEPESQRPVVRPEPEPEPESRGRPGLYAGLGLSAVALLAVCVDICLRSFFWKP
ncbi:uncharacterized protein LOC143317072 [Chaetodon auriga]|uniref:uncharacterized protein LOC143317072 n=1 Tax=Chaetodon auriga TaxID=39042 RepID=UPI004032E23C